MSNSESFETVIQTARKKEIVDVTEYFANLSFDFSFGAALISTPHTTAALLVTELDDELGEDIIRVSEHLFESSAPFKHKRNNNPNAEAHLLSAFAGSTVSLPIRGGKIQLGTYQRIVLFELDGPKDRTLSCIILGSG